MAFMLCEALFLLRKRMNYAVEMKVFILMVPFQEKIIQGYYLLERVIRLLIILLLQLETIFK